MKKQINDWLKVNIKHYSGNVPKGISKESIKQGIKVELEHTPNKKLAKAIALSHLIDESPNYYKALAKMERGLRKK